LFGRQSSYPSSQDSSLTTDPAVYYAHLAGNRARAHDPSRDRDDSDTSTSGGLEGALSRLAIEVPALKPLAAGVKASMWWM